MGLIGKIIKHFVEDSVREIVTQVYSGLEKSSILTLPPGIDACPIIGDESTKENFDQLVLIEIDDAGHSAVVGVIPKGQVNEGEIKILGRNITTGAQVSYMLCKVDGNIELNGNTDFAVRYLELEIAFNQLKLDHDNFLNEYKLHTHPYVDTPIGASTTSATVSTQNTSTADITPSKIETILVPGKVK